MAEYVIHGETLTAIADAIRTKTGDADPILAERLADAILNLAVGGQLQSKTVTPSTSEQVVTPDTGYDGLSKVTVNAVNGVEQATPGISVSSGGLITASATQAAGYVEAGTKSATKQLTTQAAQTITPGTSNKTISSGIYLTGTQTIKGDSNLVAGNIKSGVSIFGVAGTYTGTGVALQKKTGTFLIIEGSATVDCGFKPDCVAISGGNFEGVPTYPGAMFTEAGKTLIKLIVGPPSSGYLFTVLPVTQKSNGFSISEAVKRDTSGTYWSEEQRTFSYVALKYT